MSNNAQTAAPKQKNYDVGIVGGGMFGASVAWFVTDNPDFGRSQRVAIKGLADYRYSCSTVRGSQAYPFQGGPLRIQFFIETRK